MGTCELLCYHEPNCVSINFKDNENPPGPRAVSCDLNNATHRKHDNEFKDTPGYFYRGTEVNSSISSSFFYFFLVSFFDFLLGKLQASFFSTQRFASRKNARGREKSRAMEFMTRGRGNVSPVSPASSRSTIPCSLSVFQPKFPGRGYQLLSMFCHLKVSFLSFLKPCLRSWRHSKHVQRYHGSFPFIFFLTECLRNKPLLERWHLSIRFHRQRISLFVPPWLAVCTLS